jgi:alkylation response protein AidB-like acyl-CoA dehydrogenase
MVRELGRACGSTALALAMHSHLVAATVWRYRQGHSVEPFLRRVAAEQLVLIGSGASDWLASNGKAERTEGGYRVSGRKVAGSGFPAGDLLVTSAPYDDPREGPTVLHFPVPMNIAGVTVLHRCSAIAMRASGSNDVLLDRVFVPDSAISLRRRMGHWHPFFNMVITVAGPIVMSAYLGVAEAAGDLALQHVQRRRDDPEVWYLLGELANALATAELAVQGMVELCADYAFTPDVATVNAVLIRKTIAAQALTAAVEKALEAVGGGGLLQSLGLERLLRDVHGAQFHPLPAKRQHRFSGRVAFGLDPAG